MKFTIEHSDRDAIVTSTYEKLDALHAPDLKAELVQLAKTGHLNIVLDLTESRYCDSSGLSAVLVGNRMCRDSRERLSCADCNPLSKSWFRFHNSTGCSTSPRLPTKRWISFTWKQLRKSSVSPTPLQVHNPSNLIFMNKFFHGSQS